MGKESSRRSEELVAEVSRSARVNITGQRTGIERREKTQSVSTGRLDEGKTNEPNVCYYSLSINERKPHTK